MAAPNLPTDPTKMQMQMVNELELEMMADLYARMAASCQRKCVPSRYKDSELTKGESVCLDRCVSKFLEVHERIGKELQELSNPELLKKPE